MKGPPPAGVRIHYIDNISDADVVERSFSIAQFANPWHDEDGKFAPKGTGKKFGPAEEVEQLGSRQRARYDEALASFGGDHDAAMKEALRGRRNLEGMIDATDEQRKALGVPPAWRYVMIAGDTAAGGANGLLVTGVDAAGRTQNRYTEAKTREQAIKKYERTAELVQKLPALDEALAVDAATNPTAAVVELIRKTGMRVGSTDDTRAQKQAYGASTLEARHVTVDGDQTRFEFTGKKGVPIDITVDDSRLAALMSQYKGDKSGSQRLFDTGPDEANAYLKQHTDSKFKIKDLRTVRANVEARRAIAEMDPPTTKTGFRSARKRVGEAVGAVLGNRASQALKSYINPAVFNDWVFGEEVALVAAGAPTPNEEQAMVEALERLVERAPLAMSEESDVEIDAEDEADPEGLEEEDPEDTDDMDTQFGVQFANPWHDEIGRFAPKGTGRRSTGASDVAEFEPITADEARGDSQPVTADEFQRLARIGQEQLDEMKANSAPIDGLDDNWPDIQERAWTEAQKSWGGATIDARTGEFLPEGADRYALTVKDDGIETVFVPETASRAEFLDAMEQARTSFRPILERQNHFLGVFHDDDLNRIDFDPVTVVDTLDQVHTIGAATRAVGGAYNFADGNGYWPPHVADDLALAASAADGSMGEVTKFKGPGEWRRQAKQLEGAPDAPPQPATIDDEDEDRPQFAIVEFHEGGGHDQQRHAGGRRAAPDRADGTAVSTDTADGLVEAAARLEPEITATLADIVGDPDPATYDEPSAPGDADLYGYDFRLKAPDKIREKVGRQARDYGVSEDEAVGLIRDAVRYTVHTSPDGFGTTAQQLADELRKNHETVRLKNTWPNDDVPYNGVNIQVQRPDGLWFEVQVHTPESQAVKNEMHLIYQKQRVLPKSDPQWSQLEQQMFDLSASMEPPVGAEDVFRLVHPGRTVYNEGVSSTSAPTVWFRHLDVPDLRARWYWPNSTITEVNTGDGWNEADILLDLLDDASWERIDPPASGSTEFANPWHDEIGRFAPKGTGRKSTGTGTADDPIVTDDVNVAAAALHDDLHVELTSEDVAATLIDELAARVREARAAGEKAKPINLCNVSVTGSNLFCADSKGIPRVEMPQLKTFNPIPGSPADGMPRDEKGGVNLGPAFIEHMEAQGIPMVERTVPASHLKATQNELNGSTVAGMHEAIESGAYTPSPVFSTSDRYIVDGHHRWAANVAVGLGDAPDVDMPVREFDTDIITVLGMAREFTEMMGAPGASVSEGRFRSQMRLVRR